jgi:hypothetical protein
LVIIVTLGILREPAAQYSFLLVVFHLDDKWVADTDAKFGIRDGIF